MDTVRVLIVDDHPVVRRGLTVVLAGEPEIAVVGEAGNLEQALDLCRTDLPDVVLLDLRLPGILPEQAVAQIHDAHPAAQILLLSTDEAGDDLCRTLEAVPSGCVCRTAAAAELLEAIRTVHTGAAWLPPGLRERRREYRAGPHLSDRELACLRLLAAGKTTAQIAAALGLGETQVRSALGRIRKKLGARTRPHMLMTALRRGIVSLE